MHESAERRSGQTTDHPDDAPRPTSPSPAPTARYESVLYDSPQLSRGRHRAPEDPETETEEGAEDLNDLPSATQASDRQADTPDDASHYATTPPSVHTAKRLDQELGSRRFTWVREAFHEYVLRKDRIAPIVSALLLALVLWQLPDSLPQDARTTFAVFGVAVWFWVFSSIDDTYVALGGSSILVLTGVITVDEFFGPLGDTTTWLLIGAFIISTGVATSGLAMRGAVIVTAGTKNPRMLVHAVTLATVCTVFAVPATAGRAALLVPVFVALGRVLKAQHSWLVVTLSLLFPSVILLSAAGSLIGAGAHLITDQILQDNNLKSIGFASWLIAGLPLAIVTSHLAAEVILFATSSSRQRSEKLDLSLESLAEHAGGVHKIKGPLSQSESRSLLVLCLAVLLWSTESLHGIHPALVALLGGLVVVAPGFGLISLDEAIKKVPWTLLLFMAATLAMSHALTNSGAARYVAEHTLNAGSGTARAVFVLLIIVLSTLAHILIQSRSARSAVLIPMIVMLAPTVGVNPVAAAFISTAAAGFCHTLPASAKPLAMFSTIKEDIPVFTNQQLLRVSMLLLPVHIVSIIIFSFWIWPHLGLPLYL
ncbi:SLC13 family permease [Corynebacterium durum]|uniref:SLC13 family permease n=1 Tax=Corynebacterium durum TaxID=61592 RepID=UPI003606D41F